VFKHSREDGFTIIEMMVSLTVVLLVMGAALQTFNQSLQINDAATQLADANQNLRAGTNQLIRDLLMAGRVIGSEGIAMPTGPGTINFARPGPTALNFNLFTDPDNPLDPTLQLPSITSGWKLGPVINGTPTDIVTIMMVDEFMPVLISPAQNAAAPTVTEATIEPQGRFVTVSTDSLWIKGDPNGEDTPKIQVGDLVLFKGQSGNAVQTVTDITTNTIKFDANSTEDFFHFNQPNATNQVAGTGRPLAALKQVTVPTTTLTMPLPAGCSAGVVMTSNSIWCAPVTLFKVLMITYYVDNTTTPGTPRLMRLINHCPASKPKCDAFSPQALAGVVEDLDLTYDIKDGVTNPIELPALPWPVAPATPLYNAGQIRKVNVHVGVRSEQVSKPSQDYVRNHITTSVEVRSLASADRYKAQ
jgi:prepilin-type N-terminal cleavage/methylation domain-containing protein